MNKTVYSLLLFIIFSIILSNCSNNPYKENLPSENVLLGTYSSKIKYVDPVRSYYSYETKVIDQIYESLFEYHYLKRPFTVIPNLAENVPEPKNITTDILQLTLSSNNEIISENIKNVKAISYLINIKKGVLYAENKCFPLNKKIGKRTRELTVDDFILAFKRMADPRLSSPILSTFINRIWGMREFYLANKNLEKSDYAIPISGLKKHNKYSFEILLKTPYPQLKYWLCMHFTAPIPIEAVLHNAKLFGEDNVGPRYLQWPVGTGPYILKSWKERNRIILTKNELYRDCYYPSNGNPEDQTNGLLKDAGKKLPFINKIIYTFDRESTSVWNKFMQGYLDAAGIPKEQFSKAITDGRTLSSKMKKNGIRLTKAVASDIYYMGFNFDDPQVGGNNNKNRYLRQAISKAFDRRKYVKIFLNDRGIIPQGPVPPGIFGQNINTNTFASYDLSEAKNLLAKAGYKDGIDPKTGERLKLRYDNSSTSSAARPQLQFISEQFKKLGINLELATSDLNTLRTKMDKGNYQIFISGWILDYPDPENFLFLLYGPNSRTHNKGQNYANFNNSDFNNYFKKMETMPNNNKRLSLINKAVNIANKESPWIYLFHSVDFILYHDWLENIKYTELINNKLKYYRINPEKRTEFINKNNKPIYYPLIILVLIIAIFIAPGIIYLKRRYN